MNDLEAFSALQEAVRAGKSRADKHFQQRASEHGFTVEEAVLMLSSPTARAWPVRGGRCRWLVSEVPPHGSRDLHLHVRVRLTRRRVLLLTGWLGRPRSTRGGNTGLNYRVRPSQPSETGIDQGHRDELLTARRGAPSQEGIIPMNATRAKSAADSDIAKAVQTVASTAVAQSVDEAPAAPAPSDQSTNSTEPREPAPSAISAPPLLLRLEHSVRFFRDDLQALQPRLGASVDVLTHPTAQAHTVWLTAQVWQGVATIIRQTPDWQRQDVAAFLKVLHSDMPTHEPLYALLGEIIDEVSRDPYIGVPESDQHEFDFIYG